MPTNNKLVMRTPVNLRSSDSSLSDDLERAPPDGYSPKPLLVMDIKVSSNHSEALFIYEKDSVQKVVNQFAERH